MFNVVKRVLGEVVRYDFASTATEVQGQDVPQTKSLADTIVPSVQCITGVLDPFAESMSRLVESAFSEYQLHNIKGGSTRTAVDKISYSYMWPPQRVRQRCSPTLSSKGVAFVAVIANGARPATTISRN